MKFDAVLQELSSAQVAEPAALALSDQLAGVRLSDVQFGTMAVITRDQLAALVTISDGV